ncbi:unnamed protein product, partial [Symbiodinium sp. CCMP2456]
MARLAAAVLACGLLFAGAVREDALRLQKDSDELLKMIRDLQGRVSALEGQRGSESKSRCCSMFTGGEVVGYCHMSNFE